MKRKRMSSTCFTRKQVGLVYAVAKDGRIRLPRWVASAMYDLAEFYGYKNETIREAEALVRLAVEEAAAGDWEWLQEHVDEFAELYPKTGLRMPEKDVRFVGKVQVESSVLDDLKEDA